MNDKIKQLLENAEQSDAIAKNKWRIENREQLRKERQEKLKELMEKDKQQTAVEQMFQEMLEIQQSGKTLTFDENLALLEKYKEMYRDEIEAAAIISSATESTSKASSYAEGYKEGYNRALELSKWAISNLIPPHNEKQ